MQDDTEELMAALRLAWARNERLQARVRYLEAALARANSHDTSIIEDIICSSIDRSMLPKRYGGDA